MGKVKIELDLDWLEELVQEGSGISESLRDEVISSLQTKMIANAEAAIKSQIDAKVSDVAKKVITKFLTDVMNKQVKALKIPHKESAWGSELKYLSLSEYVGMKYDEFLRKRVLDEHGRHTDYERDAKYTIHEYLVQNALGKDLSKKIANMIAEARQKAEQTLIKSLESNLHNQLTADMINRLNIPSLLKSLQEKAAEIEESPRSN